MVHSLDDSNSMNIIGRYHMLNFVGPKTPKQSDATCNRRSSAKSKTSSDKVKEPTSPRQRNEYILREAKALARTSSVPDELVGRQKEKLLLQQFFDGTINQRKSGSLYIAGSPGTGKTALVDQALRQINPKASVTIKLASICFMTVYVERPSGGAYQLYDCW
jgi:predicted ATPase